MNTQLELLICYPVITFMNDIIIISDLQWLYLTSPTSRDIKVKPTTPRTNISITITMIF